MNVDTSKIDRMDVRRRIIELDAQRPALSRAADGDRPYPPEYDAEVAALEAARDEARNAADETFDAAMAALQTKFGVVDIEAAEAALEAHDEAPEYTLVADFGCDSLAVCCCLSGLPILDDDKTVRDSDGNKALRAAIPQWPTDDETADQEAA